MNCEINPNAPLDPRERISLGAIILWVLLGVFIAPAVLSLCGCKSDRVKDLELEGMFTQAESGTVAIGSIEVQAAPMASESVALKMWWDSPLLSPSSVRPCARLMMSGTNTCANAPAIVSAITEAIGVNHYAGATTNATATATTSISAGNE